MMDRTGQVEKKNSIIDERYVIRPDKLYPKAQSNLTLYTYLPLPNQLSHSNNPPSYLKPKPKAQLPNQLKHNQRPI